MTTYTRLGDVGKTQYSDVGFKLNSDLKFVPDHYLTAEICMDAVKQNGMNIEHVPSRFMTEDIIRVAIENAPLASLFVRDKLTTEMWMDVVSRNGMALNYVPTALKTPELCLAAVENNPIAIDYAVQTPSLVEFAFDKDRTSFKYIDDDLKTAEMCRYLDSDDYQYIPTRLVTPELEMKIRDAKASE